MLSRDLVPTEKADSGKKSCTRLTESLLSAWSLHRYCDHLQKHHWYISQAYTGILKNIIKKYNMHLAHLLCSLFQNKLWRGQANNGRVHDSSILKTTVGYRFHKGSTWTRVSYAHTELTNTSCLHSTQRGHIAFRTLPQLLQDHVTRAAIAWQRYLRTPRKNVTPTFYNNITVYEG